MAVDLLSYQGNANLGLGSNPDIPAATNTNLDLLNQTANQLRSQDYETNLRLFQQKINDRDSLREMLAKGIVSSGEIDDQDRPMYDEAEKRAIDAFHSIKNLNDQSNIEKFYKASTELNNVVDHAQERNLMLKQLQAYKAQETLPNKQQQVQSFIDNQRKKDFWQRIDPYQQLFSFNTDPINKLYSTTSRSYDTQDNLWHIDDTIGDYKQTYKNAQDAYLTNADVAEDMRQLYGRFSAMDKDQLAKSVDAIDKQIDLYNQQTGENVDHVKVAKDNDGNILAVQEPIQDFAAKYALANQSSYLTRSQKFNDKYGTFLQKTAQDKAKNAIDWFKANTGRLNYQLRKSNSDKQDAKQQMFVQQYDSILPNLEASDISNEGIKDIFRIPVNSLPQGFLFNQGLNSKGEPIQTIPYNVITDDKKPLGKDKDGNLIYSKDYSNAYVVPKFFIPKGAVLNGNTVGKDQSLSEDDILKFARNSGYKNVKDFIIDMNKKGLIDFDLAGQNGTATRGSSFISQMAIGDKVTNQKTDVNPYVEMNDNGDQ